MTATAILMPTSAGTPSSITLYWATQSITSSMRDYFDNRWHLKTIDLNDRVLTPPRWRSSRTSSYRKVIRLANYFERLYNIRRWTVFPRGGHFAAIEEPELLASDIQAHFDAAFPA